MQYDHSERGGLERLAERDAYVEIYDRTEDCPFKRHRRYGAPSMIVIHHSWTATVTAMRRALIGKGCGTHYAIDRDGNIIHLTPDEEVVGHCKTYNELAIGVDIIRGAGQSILDAQYSALNRLLRHLLKKWKLEGAELHKSVVFYHRDLRPTECPGEIDDSKICI